MNTPTVNATGLVSVTVTGAQPGSAIVLQGYSQNHFGTANFDNDPTPVDRSGVADANGAVTFNDLRPASNTRLRARQADCAFAAGASGPVVTVRATQTLQVTRVSSLHYRFSGHSLPARPGGLIVSLYRIVGSACPAGARPADCPGEQLVGQARAAAGNDGTPSSQAGQYTIPIVLSRSDLNTRVWFVVKTGQDAQNAPGRSNARRVLVY